MTTLSHEHTEEKSENSVYVQLPNQEGFSLTSLSILMSKSLKNKQKNLTILCVVYEHIEENHGNSPYVQLLNYLGLLVDVYVHLAVVELESGCPRLAAVQSCWGCACAWVGDNNL